jgi:hypothetical protein
VTALIAMFLIRWEPIGQDVELETVELGPLVPATANVNVPI